MPMKFTPRGGTEVSLNLLLFITLMAMGPLPVPAAVGPIPVTDRDLATAVSTALDRDLTLSRLRLTVQASSGKVTLNGQVPNLNLQREAIRLAAGQRGVLAIDDRIELRTGDPADRTVLLRIESVLSPYADLREPHLRIKVVSGRVLPSGTVGTIGRLLFLEERLSGITGVRFVDLSDVSLETERSSPAGDEILHDAILALLRNPMIFPVSGNIQVDVVDGEAILSGEVPRLIDSMEAEFVAGLVSGSGNIQNELTINPHHGRTRIWDPSGP
ncbi:MAG: BON domain-containing protein [Acidobacteria bacterium]|nr:BON domain-containing protein [Acidobacteriota bacterium]